MYLILLVGLVRAVVTSTYQPPKHWSSNPIFSDRKEASKLIIKGYWEVVRCHLYGEGELNWDSNTFDIIVQICPLVVDDFFSFPLSQKQKQCLPQDTAGEVGLSMVYRWLSLENKDLVYLFDSGKVLLLQPGWSWVLWLDKHYSSFFCHFSYLSPHFSFTCHSTHMTCIHYTHTRTHAHGL